MSRAQLARLNDFVLIFCLGVAFAALLGVGLEVLAGQERISTGKVVLR